MVNPGTYIAGYAQMTHSIHPVWGKSDYKNMIRINRKDICSRDTGWRICRQNKNAFMALSKSYLIFSANHACTLYAPDFSFFNRKRRSVKRVYRTARRGYDHFLPYGYIRGPANNL